MSWSRHKMPFRVTAISKDKALFRYERDAVIYAMTGQSAIRKAIKYWELKKKEQAQIILTAQWLGEYES